MIIDNILGPTMPEEIPRKRDNSGFHLYQPPTGGLFEEPIITPINVATWKLLLEGKTIKTDIKHKDKEGIKRLPIYITENKITANVEGNDEIQINQRIKIFNLKKTIEHRKDSYSIDKFIKANTIEKPPGVINPIHIALIYIYIYTS